MVQENAPVLRDDAIPMAEEAPRATVARVATASSPVVPLMGVDLAPPEAAAYRVVVATPSGDASPAWLTLATSLVP